MYMYVHVCKTDMANITLIDEYATYFTKRKMIFTLELNKVYLSFNIPVSLTLLMVHLYDIISFTEIETPSQLLTAYYYILSLCTAYSLIWPCALRSLTTLFDVSIYIKKIHNK